MTTWSDRLALIVTADTKGAVAGLEAVGTTAERELTKAQTKLDATGRNLTRLGVGSIAAGAVIGAGLYKAAQAYDEANKASLQLENTIRNQPALAGANAKALEGLAQSIQHKTAADGDEIVAGMAKLGMYGANEAALRQLTPLVVDYARKTGKDMVAAYTDVGKALNGQTRGLKASGVVIDENAYATDRLSAITDALTKSVGGFAEREGKTFSGQMQRLKNDAMDLAEGLGKGVSDALGDLTGAVDTATKGFGALGEGGQATLGRFATYGAGVLVLSGAISVTAGQVIKFRDQIKAIPGLLDRMAVGAYDATGAFTSLGGSLGASLAGGFITVGVAATPFIAQMLEAKGKAEALSGAMKELNDEAKNLGDTVEDVAVKSLDELIKSGDGPLEKSLGKWKDLFVNFSDQVGLTSGELQTALQGSDSDFEAFTKKMEEAAIRAGNSSSGARVYVRVLKELRTLFQGFPDAASQLIASHEKIDKATTDSMGVQWAYGQSLTDTANAEKDAAKAKQDAARKIEDADRNIADAERNVRDAQRDTADAIADVGKAYDEARKQADDYKDSVTQGGFSVREAQFGVADAQQALTEAQAKGDPTEIAKAQLRLEEAQYRLEQANKDLTEAQKNLNDANQRGLDKSPQVLAAQQRVKDAKDRERDATDRLKQAEKDKQTAVEEGAQAVEEANGKVLDALRKQNEALWIAIANWDALAKAQRLGGGDGYIAGGANRGGRPDDPAGGNGGRAPTGGRSAVGPKSGVTNINVYVDGVTQTTKSAIHQGIKKASKQAAISYYRRAA